MKKKLAVDQDQVLCDLTGEWLKRYNYDYNDTLTVEDVTEWCWDHLVKPECGDKIYTYLDDPELFETLPVIEGAQEVLRKLSDHYEIFVVTACRNLNNIPPKSRWLQKHFDFIPSKNHVFARNKSIIGADWLIDDKPENLETFCGYRMLFDAPHNRKDHRFLRMDNWHDIDRFFFNNFLYTRYDDEVLQ